MPLYPPLPPVRLSLGSGRSPPNGGFPKLGVLFGGPYNKDYNILGSILGFPYFGKLPNASFTQLILGLSISPCSRLHCIYYAPNASPELAEKHINSAQKLHRTIRSLQTRQTFGEKLTTGERGAGRACPPTPQMLLSLSSCLRSHFEAVRPGAIRLFRSLILPPEPPLDGRKITHIKPA